MFSLNIFNLVPYSSFSSFPPLVSSLFFPHKGGSWLVPQCIEILKGWAKYFFGGIKGIVHLLTSETLSQPDKNTIPLNQTSLLAFKAVFFFFCSHSDLQGG